MDFINTSVNIHLLPGVDDVTLRPVHASYKKIMHIEWMITTIVLAVAGSVLVFTDSIQSAIGLITLNTAVIVLSVFYFISIQKSFPFLAYAVREKDVILQKGWIIRRIKICPFNRIQNCSVQSGPLERKYGLASLVIYTAGTNGADMRIGGLLHDEAEKLRHFILSKIHAEPDETT